MTGLPLPAYFKTDKQPDEEAQAILKELEEAAAKKAAKKAKKKKKKKASS